MSEICTKNMERNDICPDDTEPIYLTDSEEGIASLLTMDDFTAVYELADKTRRGGGGRYGAFTSHNRIFQCLSETMPLLWPQQG